MAVAPIFRDEKLQTLFDRQGFVVIPFLDTPDLDSLQKLFAKLHPDLPTGAGFISGSYSNDLDYKREASDAIVNIYTKHFDRVFQNYQPFGAAFLYKLPSSHSELGVHQDWTIVDEEKYVALNCWIPLTDIDEHNGALHVMPGSHYPAYHTLRAPTIPFFFSGSEEEVIGATIPFYIKAGEAVILNQSVIHFSPPNRSDRIRTAITAGVKTKGAPMIFHYKNDTNTVTQYQMPEDFLIRFEDFAKSIFKAPALGEKIAELPYQDPTIATSDVQSILKKLKCQAMPKLSLECLETKSSFFKRITQLFYS
jgi:hypothetical protein